jgi:tetratricopeptide (TPR) repeat protein
MREMSRASSILVVAALLAATPCAQGQIINVPSDPDFSEADRADVYFTQNKMLEALPLYQHLAAQEPENAVFHERLAFCLMSSLSTLPAGKERDDVMVRAKAEAERARSLGDSSNLLRITLETLARPSPTQSNRNPFLDAGEAAFVRGDMDAALAGYQAAAKQDPTSYSAHLFSGDVYFRKHDVKLAGEWFQRAIAIDPDRETAHRYWGDALLEAGEKEAALTRFIDAVVAEPYSRNAWMGLERWTRATGATLKPPVVPVPKAPEVTSGKPGVTINVDPSKDPRTTALWLAYSANRALWRAESFAKRFPEEKSYRHSLAEEAESLHGVLLVLGDVGNSARVDASLRDLVRLGKEGMIEPYVLINAADDGIAADYPAYRASHREQLHAYVEKFVIHRSVTVH